MIEKKKIQHKYEKWLEPENLAIVQGWYMDGLTDAQVAEKIGVHENSIRNWRKSFPQFNEACKIGKDVADRKVEMSLYQSALGFKMTVEKAIKLKTVKKKESMVIEEERVEYVDEEIYIPPSNVAQFFWLKNRKPNVWKDKQEITDTKALDKLDGILSSLKEQANATETEANTEAK